MPASYAEHLERAHDFVGWFRAGVFSARVHLAKPDPTIFDLAAARFGGAPSEQLFIDDQLPQCADGHRARRGRHPLQPRGAGRGGVAGAGGDGLRS